jgi:hypothetical protein
VITSKINIKENTSDDIIKKEELKNNEKDDFLIIDNKNIDEDLISEIKIEEKINGEIIKIKKKEESINTIKIN